MLIRSGGLISRRSILGYPRATLSDVTNNYMGAFKMPGTQFGTGTIAIDSGTQKMFGVGNETEQLKILQTSIPALVNESNDPSLLNSATVEQTAVSMYSKIPATAWDATGEARAVVRGMYHDGTYLYVNGIGYYDTRPNQNDTTFRINTPNDLANTTVTGCFQLGGATFSNDWFSPIPQELRRYFGGRTHISGASTTHPIVGRLSKGINLRTFNASVLASAVNGESVSTTEHMSYASNWMHPDLLNYEGAMGRVNNALYVLTSYACYACIIPGTRTYFGVGYSEGYSPGPLNYVQTAIEGYTANEPGAPCSNPYVGLYLNGEDIRGEIFYKNLSGNWTDSVGRVAEGYLSWTAASRGYYYWMFDLDQILSSPTTAGLLPYEYGEFPAPFRKIITSSSDGAPDAVKGGTMDEVNNILYLSIPFADTDGQFPGNNVIAAYQL